jgi:outer membrane protein OmpA-like peptidoglycan-associated protein
MKTFIVILLVCAAFQSSAQNAFRRIHNKVASSIEAKAGDRIAEAATAPLDKNPEPSPNDNPAKSQPAASEKEDAGNSITTFSKYDFIPGDRILYAHDFAGEAIGELPMGWNTDGMAEVVTINQYPGNWLQFHQNNTYLSSNTSKFGDNYTLEFDLILNLKNLGYTYPYLTFGVIAANPMAPGDNSVLSNLHQAFAMDVLVRPAGGSQSYVSVSSTDKGRNYYSGNQQNFGRLESYYGKPVHVAMQVQKERLRIWIGEQKIFDAPKVMMPAYDINQLYFKVSGSSYQESQVGIYLSNIKVATGVADNRSELATKGKFTTKGIRFEFQKSDILPESYPVIKEIAAVLKENPGMKIRIVGHTSNDGDAAANLELSKQRAAAIKDFLVSNFEIAEANLLTDGKGGTQPADKGITPEAKANNRRVEFIKI